MQPHENLFNHYGNKADVYRKLQKDYLRDQKQNRWLQGAFVLLLMAAGFVHDSEWKQVLYFGVGFVIFQYMILFVDLSNRNFLMHAIDWFEAKNSDS